MSRIEIIANVRGREGEIRIEARGNGIVIAITSGIGITIAIRGIIVG